MEPRRGAGRSTPRSRWAHSGRGASGPALASFPRGSRTCGAAPAEGGAGGPLCRPPPHLPARPPPAPGPRPRAFPASDAVGAGGLRSPLGPGLSPRRRRRSCCRGWTVGGGAAASAPGSRLRPPGAGPRRALLPLLVRGCAGRGGRAGGAAGAGAGGGGGGRPARCPPRSGGAGSRRG